MMDKEISDAITEGIRDLNDAFDQFNMDNISLKELNRLVDIQNKKIKFINKLMERTP